MDYLKSRLVRKVLTGARPIGWLYRDLYECKIDEIAVCTAFCFRNGGPLAKFTGKIGVKSGDIFYGSEGTIRLAVGGYFSLKNPIYLRERDSLRLEIFCTVSDGIWELWAEIHVFLVDHTKT